LARIRVVIDRDKCLGCGAAPATCSKVFVLGSDNGKNRVVDEYSVELTPSRSVGIVPEELRECVEAAAQVCPVGAITVEVVE
jgi:ferredoxin